MKKLVLLIGLIATSVAYADYEPLKHHNTPSIFLGASSIGGDFGGVFQATSPFFLGRSQVQLELHHLSFGGRPYSVFEFGFYGALYDTDRFRMGFKTMITFYFAPNDFYVFSRRKNDRGLHYSLTGEYFLNKSFSLNLEVGLAMAFHNLTQNGETFGNGFSVVLGPKFYF